MLSQQSFSRHSPCLQWLFNKLAQEAPGFTLLEYYGICQNVDTIQGEYREIDVWKALGTLADVLPIAALSCQQGLVMRNILRKHGVLPVRYMRMSVKISDESQFPKLDFETLVERIECAYEHSLEGNKLSDHEATPFFRQCAEVSLNFTNRTLIKLMFMVALHQCRDRDIVGLLWKTITNRGINISTADSCCLLNYFAALRSPNPAIISRLSATIIKRTVELTYENVMHALQGMHCMYPRMFMSKLWDILVRKFMEEVNDTEQVSLSDLSFLLETAKQQGAKIPSNFLNALVRYAGPSVHLENTPELVNSLLSKFVDAGITRPAALAPFTSKLHITIEIMGLASVLELLDICAKLDEPLAEVIVLALSQAAKIVQDASIDESIRLLSFLSKMAGAEKHPIIDAIVPRIHALVGDMSAYEALQLINSLFELSCQYHDVLVTLAVCIAKGNMSDMATAKIVARVCVETQCREPLLLNFYHKIVLEKMSSSTAEDLVAVLHTVMTLQVDVPELPQKILSMLISHFQKQKKYGRDIPEDIAKSIQSFQNVLGNPEKEGIVSL